MSRRLLGNGLAVASWAPAWFRHQAARRRPRAAQRAALRRFLRANRDTAYGRAHGYGQCGDIDEFQRRVPIVTYEALEPWIDRIAGGEANVLTAEPVERFEATSGSSGARKLIPFTRALRHEFQAAVGAWMVDLFGRRPGLWNGAQYWSITPAARERECTAGGIPIGIEDDGEYLAPLARRALGWVLAVPPHVAQLTDMSAHRLATIDGLIRTRDLRFISVWNPSYLSLLLDALPRGCAPADCWPTLQTVSCWTDAGAARFLPELRRRLPGVEIQGKGLLATEGVVSIPTQGRPSAEIALTGHFLEFRGADGRCRLVDELETGARYEVIMTTGAGFARYAIGDEVICTAPGCVRFAGRRGGVSDLCGEKLQERFVGSAVETAVARRGGDGLMLLAPAWGRPPHYRLYAESGDAAAIALEVESELRASLHYDHCRRLGQLGPVEGVALPNGRRRYLEACAAAGQRLGDVKPVALRAELDWDERLGLTRAA